MAKLNKTLGYKHSERDKNWGEQKIEAFLPDLEFIFCSDALHSHSIA